MAPILLYGGLGAAVLLAVAVLGGLAYIYSVTRDLPSVEALQNYSPPVTTRVYAGNGTVLGEYAREWRIFVPDLLRSQAGDGGLHLAPKTAISTTIPASIRRGILRAAIKDVGNGAARPAARKAPPPSPSRWRRNFLLNSDVKFTPQDPRGDPRDPHRRDLSQGQDPRALSQRDLSRRKLLRRRRGGAELFRQVARRARCRRSRLPGGAAQGARPITIRASITQAALDRRNWVIGQMARKRLHHRRAGQGRDRRAADHPDARARQPDRRRRLFRRGSPPPALCAAMASSALYDGGLQVRSSLDTRCRIMP